MTKISESIVVVEHVNRPEWGRGVVVESMPDRVAYFFESGGRRTFRRDDAHLRSLDLPAAERTEARRAILRRAALTRRDASDGSARAARPPATTFDEQLARFRVQFPLGFEDPAYIHDERGAASGKGRYKDAAIALAADSLSKDELDALLAKHRAGEVWKRAVKVLRTTRNLVHPKTEKPIFEAMPSDSHAAFALALRELLHGEGEYASRFDRVVFTLGMKVVPWAVATLFPALVHPTEHTFVTGKFSVGQARILELDEPPLGFPTGLGYEKHLAVARALEARLVAAGLAPRDLFDVHTFSGSTQRRSEPA